MFCMLFFSVSLIKQCIISGSGMAKHQIFEIPGFNYYNYNYYDYDYYQYSNNANATLP